MENVYLENLIKTQNIHSFIDTESIWGQKKYHNNNIIKPIKSLTIIDEGGITKRSWYGPARMYNKDKTEKYLVGFFILLMPIIISPIILMRTKVIIQQTVASFHRYTT